jgi:hypothetical protein
MKTHEQKVADALAYLGTKHCLHPEYRKGTVNPCPDKTNVKRTIKSAMRNPRPVATERESRQPAPDLRMPMDQVCPCCHKKHWGGFSICSSCQSWGY